MPRCVCACSPDVDVGRVVRDGRGGQPESANEWTSRTNDAPRVLENARLRCKHQGARFR